MQARICGLNHSSLSLQPEKAGDNEGWNQLPESAELIRACRAAPAPSSEAACHMSSLHRVPSPVTQLHFA